MLEELLEALYPDDEDRWFRVEAANWSADDLRLDAVVRADGTEETRWQIDCTTVIDCSLTDVAGGGLNHITDVDHPLLAQFRDEQAQLFFRGTPANPARVIGDLWLAGRREWDDWIDFDRYLRAEDDVEMLLKGGGGQLGEGPVFVLETYADVLRANGIEPSLIGHRPYMRWNGAEWATAEACEAIHFGNSSVVAVAFEARRLVKQPS